MFKKVSIPLLALSFIILTSPAFGDWVDFKPGSSPDGFRGIKWGQELSSIPGMIHHAKTPVGENIYKKTDDKLTIGGAELQNIFYVFWSDKLMSVYITAEGLQNWESLRDTVFTKFGKGQRDSDDQPYGWVDKKARMTLAYDKKKKESRLKIFSLDVLNQKEEDLKKKTLKGVNDF